MPGYSRERFDDSVITREADGSVAASNQLYDLNSQPAPSSGDGENDNMMLDKNGKAFYSKGLSNGDSSGTNTSAFTNPLYEVGKDFDSSEGQNGVERTLPSNGELTFPDSDLYHNHSNA